MFEPSSADLLYLGAMAGVFASVLSLVLAARHVTGGRTDPVRERLRRVTGAPQASATAAAEPGSTGRGRGLLAAALAPLARVATPSDQEEMGRLRAILVQAGYRAEHAVSIYLGIKVAATLLLGALSVWVLSRWPQELSMAALIVVGSMTAAFYAPSLYVGTRAKERRAAIEHALPNALDMLVTCVEAGLGLDAALSRVAAEIGLGAPLLADEFHQTALEMSAGLNRGEAFRRMAERTGVDEVRSLAAIIVQTQMFGTSIARSLRVQAESMRVRRMQQAEERAATVAVKMTFPLIFCIVPSLFVVLMGPGAVKIIRELLPTLGGN